MRNRLIDLGLAFLAVVSGAMLMEQSAFGQVPACTQYSCLEINCYSNNGGANCLSIRDGDCSVCAYAPCFCWGLGPLQLIV
jgi:hypothetical protein